MPFDPLIPNMEIVEAMREARRDKLVSFENIDALMADLMRATERTSRFKRDYKRETKGPRRSTLEPALIEIMLNL